MTASSNRFAFSLVEVTLAIGIIGFALLGIFALIPIGLNSSRDAVDDTTTSLICQDISNRIKSEVATNEVAIPWTNSSGLDAFQLRWNPNIRPTAGLSYSGIGNMPPSSYGAAPGASTAVAYYDSAGTFVKQTPQNRTETVDPARNFIRADIQVRPLFCDPSQVIPASGAAPAYDSLKTSYPEFVRPRNTSSGTTDYAYLGVHVSLGWPATPVADGALVSASAAGKKIYTFYLKKP